MILNKLKQLFKNKELMMYLIFILIFILYVVIGINKAKPSGQNGGGVYDYLAFKVGDFEVRWYAVFIITGIVFAYFFAKREFKRLNWSIDILFDGLLIFLPASIIGGRLWYIIFNWGQVNSLIDVFAVWDGGLAIHGAVMVTFIGLIYFTRWKKINYWLLLDIVAIGFFFGQIMGRWGNFFNHELYGPAVASNSFLNYIIPPFIKNQMMVGGTFHHPAFLYESLLNLVGLIFLLIIRKKKIFKAGDMLAFYLSWYGVVRIFTESLRMVSGNEEDPLKFLGMPVSIAISVAFIIAGILIIILKRKYIKNLPYYATADAKLILFDLDGTLLDTKDAIYASFNKVFTEKMPHIALTDKDYVSFIGPTLEHSFSRFEKDPKKVEQYVELYRKNNRKLHEQGIKPFPHAKETILGLKDKGYLIGVVSSKKREFVELGLQQNELLGLMDVLVCSDDVSNHKPHPEALLKALTETDVLAANAVYVGDHESDIIAGHKADMKTVAVSYSVHYDKLLAQNPEYVIDDLSKLLQIF